MSAYTYPCCACCTGIALDDHVEHGGWIETDGHETGCTSKGCEKSFRPISLAAPGATRGEGERDE